MSDQRSSDSDQTKRDIPSFIEPRPPLILNPFMRPRPQKGTNLLEQFEEDSDIDEPEWVQVYLRLKPCNVRNNLYEVKSDRCLITSVDTAPMGHGRRTQHNVSKMYTFSHIFGPESSQREIFEQVVKGNLKKLPEGHNFTLLTYGASGSGKTYTLMGTVQSPGLVPRSLEYVFRVVDAAQQPVYKPSDGGAEKLDYYDQDFELQFVKKLRHVSAPLRDKYRRMSAQLRSDLTASTLDLTNRTRYYVWVSFVEIYNEAIYDLLSNSDRSKATSKLRIREDSSGNAYVKGATQVFVRTGEEAYDVMVAGKHNLQVAATGVHANSSRSHCIFTITMLTETDDGVRTSCVRLCDLAGCERARHTQNTGARMQESRAINSSLHVLERCLHMLRRKQKQKVEATLVPYRESKLTRLLGAGLSGSRGEGVSMVVTLNPAPHFAQETKHVLQLAAVAKDIQVNQTIAESTLSTLESSTQDSTICASAEIMKLRAENERLHFELVQAQAHNKELMSAMEEKNQEVAKTMYDILEEAKAMTRQYYESQLQSIRSEMEEMQDDYENRLKAATCVENQRISTEMAGTPSKSQQKKIAELMTEIAILEEKLTAEKLARARAEEEVQHLRACIEERDEKAEEVSLRNTEDVMSVSDSETDEEVEPDPYNESLEPTFRKEDINRSRLLLQSLLVESRDDTVGANDSESSIDKSSNTLKDADEINDDTVKDSTYLSEDRSTSKTSMTYNIPYATVLDKTKDIQELEDTRHNSNRDTYVVTDEATKLNDTEMMSQKISKGLAAIDRIRKSMEDMEKSIEKNIEKSLNNATEVNKEMKSRLFNARSDVSLAQFEQLELASKTDDGKPDVIETFSNIKILKEKRNFFDNDQKEHINLKLNKDKTYFDNIDVNIEPNKKLNEIRNILNDERSPSIVKEDVTGNFELSTIKKMLGESFTRQPEPIESLTKVALPKKHASVDIFEGFDSPCIAKTQDLEVSRITQLSAKKPILEELQTKDDVSLLPSHSIQALKDNFHVSDKSIIDFAKPESTPKGNHSFETIKDKSCFCEENIGDFVKPTNPIVNIKSEPKAKVSIFEKCVEKVSLCPMTTVNVENTRKSMENLNLKEKLDIDKERVEIKIKQERISIDTQKVVPVNKINESHLELQTNFSNNTVEDFETLYKDITAPRATEFDLLVSQVNISNNSTLDFEKARYNLRHTKINTPVKQKEIDTQNTNKRDRKDDKKEDYLKKDTSLERKKPELNKKDLINDLIMEKKVDTEVLAESQANGESKSKPKRNLRLRKRRNQDDADQDSETKLKDIVNLQKEFSDVTMDVPAPVKEAKDIESPKKAEEEENLPPLVGIQSCPSKSVQRSRRKLFTPRAEPLEESTAQSGDSNERVRVPRPSYHRTRARRKL